ncbi:MAG TPA: Crp/Fnr family transcriptional regulator [Terriglobales bacterium]|nr:Crp/Fnr family transcriptional regulator [Terriglobales bacterium]
MLGPYGFELNESCRTSKLREESGFFCQLPTNTLKDLDDVGSLAAYPAGAVLFLEKQNSRGVYVLCEGQVKLSISSREGKTMILRIAQAGEVLGLMAVLSGSSYEVTAETLHPCQVVFIYRDEFLHFLTQHPEANQNMIKQLTAEYQSACEQLRTIGLSASIPGRLAKLLLGWSVGGQQTKSGTEFTISMTHEEIAECIGVTRETVSRTLGQFKIRHLVTLRGSTLTIPSRAALENIC